MYSARAHRLIWRVRNAGHLYANELSGRLVSVRDKVKIIYIIDEGYIIDKGGGYIIQPEEGRKTPGEDG